MVVKPPDNQIVLLDEGTLDLIDFSIQILGFIQMIVERGFVNDNQVLSGRCGALANVQSGAEGRGNALDHSLWIPGLESVDGSASPRNTDLFLDALNDLVRCQSRRLRP